MGGYLRGRSSSRVWRTWPRSHRQLNAPVILIWYNLNTYISTVMRELAGTRRDWLTVIQRPACAPDLNPAKGVRRT
jgi:hypothetical protein